MKFLKLFLFLVLGSICLGSAFSTLGDDLISYWKFDEISGVTAFDSKGSNDGTLSNSDMRINGLINNGINVKPSPLRVMGTNFNPGSVIGSGDFSVSTFVKSESLTDFATLWQFGRNAGSSTSANAIHIMTDQNNNICFWSRFGTSGGGIICSSDKFQNEWQHIVLTRTGNNIKVYLNGNEIISNTRSDNSVSGFTHFRVGSRVLNNGNPFNGLLDELAIYNRALSQAEIEILYNNGYGLQYPFSFPIPIIEADIQDFYNSENISINLTTNTEELTNMSYSLDNGTLTSICNDCNSSILNLNGLSEGTHSILFVSENENGQVNSTYNFTVDTIKPTIDNNIPNEINTYFFNSSQFNCTDINLQKCFILIDNQNLTNTQNTTLNFNGLINYTIFAEDLAGNNVTETGSIFVNPFQYFYFEDQNTNPITNFTLGGVQYDDFAAIKLYDLGLGSHSLDFKKFGFLADLINITFTNTSIINQTSQLSFAKIVVNIRDKSTGALITGENFTLQLISSIGVNQFTTTGVSEFQNLLFKANSYQVVASNVNYFTEDLFFTFTNEEVLTLNIYMTEVTTTNAGVVFISVLDGLGQPIPAVTVQALQWDSTQSAYIRVSEGLTGLDGRSTLNVILEDKIYKFKAFKDDKEVLSPQYRLLVTDNQKLITLTLEDDAGRREYLLSNFNFDAKQISYVNNVSTLQVDWTQTAGIEQEICLVAYRYRLNSEVKLQEYCKTGASTQLIESFFINSSQNIIIKVELVQEDNSRFILKTFRFPASASLPNLTMSLGLGMFIIPLLFLGSIALGITIQNVQVGAMLVVLSAAVSMYIVPTLITGGIVTFLSFVSMLIIWAVTGGRK